MPPPQPSPKGGGSKCKEHLMHEDKLNFSCSLPLWGWD